MDEYDIDRHNRYEYSKLPVGEKSPLQVHFIGRLQAFSAL